ncbi:hypothetical protein BH20ACT11_BH20ACT11_09290 [soil metagenome]
MIIRYILYGRMAKLGSNFYPGCAMQFLNNMLLTSEV